MKVIDLLNKIANGEEVPEKIKYRNKIFIYDKDNQCYVVENYNEYCDLHMSLSNHKGTDLNYEVEIIEEDKKIEKVNTYVLCDRDFETMGKHSTKATEIIDKAFEEYSYKINEIIDYLEENK